MRKPVSYYQVATVQRLIKAGCSNREAARRAGVSAGTADKIAAGKHVSQFSESSDEVTFHDVPEYECPNCRRRVKAAPCPACVARRGR